MWGLLSGRGDWRRSGCRLYLGFLFFFGLLHWWWGSGRRLCLGLLFFFGLFHWWWGSGRRLYLWFLLFFGFFRWWRREIYSREVARFDDDGGGRLGSYVGYRFLVFHWLLFGGRRLRGRRRRFLRRRRRFLRRRRRFLRSGALRFGCLWGLLCRFCRGPGRPLDSLENDRGRGWRLLGCGRTALVFAFVLALVLVCGFRLHRRLVLRSVLRVLRVRDHRHGLQLFQLCEFRDQRVVVRVPVLWFLGAHLLDDVFHGLGQFRAEVFA